MEEDICILISDLSGYTALTETHGAVSAADLIDKYIAIVEDCIVGDSHLKERIGDELMIVSTTSDALLATATNILNTTSQEHNFLQVHGGLHYGKLLKRRDSYFGSAINLTSRIAAKASPGTFWCSEEFVQSLSDKSVSNLKSMGKHSFKNITGFVELYELRSENINSVFIDSVCRMLILDTNQAIKHPSRDDIFFCSSNCLDIYLRNQLTNHEVN
ncbi:adenylate/guanylate cyclase domain-containing protein [Arenibacter algicola]|uniref:adenylate/guanylate cyclase domain-containing protein n=1 Tax=Arenibacter algicola TaxID=616991 RepID=UPI001C07DF09|nr:adenylate/guanylate cyclase domain-containing protein [Arenibacter algicola]MBU2906530.1 adenylate/guanylate cyclase domain-containing protein [Arenibacter algicola]